VTDYCKIDLSIHLSSGLLPTDGLIKRILKLTTSLKEGESYAIGYLHLLLGLIKKYRANNLPMAERMEKTLLLQYRHVMSIVLRILCDSNFHDFMQIYTTKKRKAL